MRDPVQQGARCRANANRNIGGVKDMNEAAQVAAGAPKPAVGAAAGQQEFLSFTLGREAYGIDILKVQEIRSYEQPTTIANAPAFIKGGSRPG